MKTLPCDYFGARQLSPEQQAARLRRAIENELTERQKRVVEEYFFNNRRMPDIARELGVNKSTVARTLRRALLRLQRSLKY